MKRIRMMIVLALCCLLTGCASLLEREYISVEPHSGRFWESEAADILRAEGYQDVVNDLMLLVSQHTETATLRLYNFKDEARVTETLERAAEEVRRQTPLGAYAVNYITSSSQQQRGYFEVSIRIGYRRTEEQVRAVAVPAVDEGGSIYAELKGGKGVVRLADGGGDGVGGLPRDTVDRLAVIGACQRARRLTHFNARGKAQSVHAAVRIHAINAQEAARFVEVTVTGDAQSLGRVDPSVLLDA